MLAGTVLLSSWLENIRQNLLSWEKASSTKLKHLWDSVLKPGEVSDALTRVQRSVGSQGWALQNGPRAG